MRNVSPLPTHGTVFFDDRDHARSMRVSFHPQEGVFVISMWRNDVCLSTFRLPAGTADELVHVFVEALAASYSTDSGRTEIA